ncbi:MAG TPA: 50S ribosomal protein L29, partial [bacterium]|nr:50S ribosomal protein L29 [bacterium]
MKSAELKKMSETELKDKLDGFKQELFNLRWQTASHQNKNPKRTREVKRAIARILT